MDSRQGTCIKTSASCTLCWCFFSYLFFFSPTAPTKVCTIQDPLHVLNIKNKPWSSFFDNPPKKRDVWALWELRKWVLPFLGRFQVGWNGLRWQDLGPGAWTLCVSLPVKLRQPEEHPVLAWNSRCSAKQHHMRAAARIPCPYKRPWHGTEATDWGQLFQWTEGQVQVHSYVRNDIEQGMEAS
jgi:hypothetical protein